MVVQTCGKVDWVADREDFEEGDGIGLEVGGGGVDFGVAGDDSVDEGVVVVGGQESAVFEEGGGEESKFTGTEFVVTREWGGRGLTD